MTMLRDHRRKKSKIYYQRHFDEDLPLKMPIKSSKEANNVDLRLIF